MSRFSDPTSKFIYKLNNIKKIRKKCLECMKYIEENKEKFNKKTFIKYTNNEMAMINSTLHLELFEAKKFSYDFISELLTKRDYINYLKREDIDTYNGLMLYFNELKKWYKECVKNDK